MTLLNVYLSSSTKPKASLQACRISAQFDESWIFY